MESTVLPERKTLSVPEAAALLGLSPERVYTLIRQDKFPTPVLHLGTRVVVPTQPLLDALGVAS